MNNNHQFKLNDIVFWTDPDNRASSGQGTITHIQHDEDDAIISIKKDDGGEVEALPHELRLVDRKHPCVAVVGRIPHDDEDSCYIFEDMTRAEAAQAFEDVMYAEDGNQNPDQVEKENGSTVYINHILVSDSPITLI